MSVLRSALLMAIAALSCASVSAQTAPVPKLIPKGEITWEQPYSAGLLFLSHEDWESALRYFVRAVKVNPRDPRPWFQAGLCRGKLGDTEGKFRDYRHAIRLDPKYADPHYSLGISYILVGQHCDAIHEYVVLKSLDKTLAERLGQLLEMMTDDPQGNDCVANAPGSVQASARTPEL
jgi:tetratricopeptide (TPR) repeat protein